MKKFKAWIADWWRGEKIRRFVGAPSITGWAEAIIGFSFVGGALLYALYTVVVGQAE